MLDIFLTNYTGLEYIFDLGLFNVLFQLIYSWCCLLCNVDGLKYLLATVMWRHDQGV